MYMIDETTFGELILKGKYMGENWGISHEEIEMYQRVAERSEHAESLKLQGYRILGMR